MSNERMRVAARMMLIGKSRTGNCFTAFSVFLRVAVYGLIVLAVVRFDYFMSSVAGRIILALCGVAVVLGILLLQCARTVKDRWYCSLCEGEQIDALELIISFSLRDVLLSVKVGAVSFFYMLSRFAIFFAFPLAVAVLSLLALRDGVSRNVLAALLVGDLVLLSCGAFFTLASVNCISLSRSFSCEAINGFVSRFMALERSAFLLMRFDIPLSVFNRSHRRLSKILFVRSLLGTESLSE